MMNFFKSIKDNVIQIQSRSMSDPSLSDMDFEYKMAWVWTTLEKMRSCDFIIVAGYQPNEKAFDNRLRQFRKQC